MMVEHSGSLVEPARMPGICKAELFIVEMMAEFVTLCCRQHKRIYVAQRFMWRSRRGHA